MAAIRPDVATRGRSRGTLDPALVPTPLVDARELQPVPIVRGANHYDKRRVLATLAGLTWFYAVRRLTRSYDPAEFGRRLRIAFERLGGVWVKLGQLLALRKDLFHIDLCLELSRLHDRATAFPGELARQVIEEDFARPLESIFSEFDLEPIAAASIGQCHIARLAESGEQVAVKVQRPEADGSFRRDLRLVRLLLLPFHWMGAYSHFRWNDFVWELENILNEELDYRFELNSIRTMRKNLKKHSKIYVPAVHERWCSRRVLVLEYITGVFMSDYLAVAQREPGRVQAWLAENGVSPAGVARRLYHSFLRQLLEDNVFHGDLHPGNIVLLRDDWVCLIDFGTVSRLEHQMVHNFNLVMAYIGSRSYSKAVAKFLSLADALPAVDLHDLRTDMLRVFLAWDRRTRIKDIPYAEKSMVSLWAELGQVVMNYRLVMDWSFLRVDRATLTLDVSLQELFPEMNFPRELQRYYEGYGRRLGKNAKLPDARTLVRAQWLSLLSNLPDTAPVLLSDLSLLVRRQSRNFRATTTKIAFLCEVFLAQIRAGLVATTAFFGLAWAYQRPGVFPSLEGLEGRFADFLGLVPELKNLEWVAVMGSLLWLVRLSGKIIQRFRRPEPGSAGRAPIV